MYKLLIVDDEPLVLVGIKSMVNWHDLDIEIIGSVSNGKQALELMETDLPDIVLTDIKMPIMDGLELLKASREKYGNTLPAFIMLTSYEDFRMAKEAITYHASDYLIKVELSEELLKSTILKVIEQLEITKATAKSSISDDAHLAHLLRDKFMISLLNNLFESEEQFRLQAEDLSLQFDSPAYLCCYGEFISGNSRDLAGRDFADRDPADRNPANRGPSSSDPAGSDPSKNNSYALFSGSLQMLQGLLEKYFEIHVLALDSTHFALILGRLGDGGCADEEIYENTADILGRVCGSLHNYYNVDIFCGIGTIVKNILSISDSFQYARSSFRKCSKSCPVTYLSEREDLNVHAIFNISLFKKDLTRAFEEYDSKLLESTLDNLLELISAHPEHFVQALDLASNLLYLSISLMQDGDAALSEFYSDSPESYLSLYRLSSVGQIVDWLKHYKNCMSELFEERRKDYKNRIVADVKKYISEHVYDKLTLNEIAALFGISPGYLSQLFGKYNDSGFSEYINICKIAEAKRLLKQEKCKVYEVADRLKFGNEFYFSKVFKKVEGITPTEYLGRN